MNLSGSLTLAVVRTLRAGAPGRVYPAGCERWLACYPHRIVKQAKQSSIAALYLDASLRLRRKAWWLGLVASRWAAIHDKEVVLRLQQR